MWHVLENTSVRVCLPYYFDITVGNVFPEPVILYVILSNREDPLHMYQARFILLSPFIMLMSDTRLWPYSSSLPPEHLTLSYC